MKKVLFGIFVVLLVANLVLSAIKLSILLEPQDYEIDWQRSMFVNNTDHGIVVEHYSKGVLINTSGTNHGPIRFGVDTINHGDIFLVFNEDGNLIDTVKCP